MGYGGKEDGGSLVGDMKKEGSTQGLYMVELGMGRMVEGKCIGVEEKKYKMGLVDTYVARVQDLMFGRNVVWWWWL